MKYVFKELFRLKKELCVIVLTVIGTTLCTLGMPFFLARLVDHAIPEKNFAHVFEIGGIMIMLVAIGILCGIVTSHASAVVSMSVGRNLRSKIFKRVQYFSQAEIDNFSASSLITRTNNDITQIQVFLNQCLRIAIQAPIMCVCGIILAFSNSPSLSRVLIISVPVMVVALVIIAKIAMPLSTKIQLKIDRINLVMREKLTGVRVIRAFGTLNFESKRFEEINKDYFRTNKKLQRTTNSLMPILTIILSCTAALVMLMAANQFAHGADYTIGEVMAIIQYVMQIMLSVIMLTIVFVLLPRAATAAARTKEVLETEPSIENPAQPKDNTNVRGYLTFKDVSFTYPGADVPAIKGLSFEAKPGEVTAFIGGTGMGKTTAISLIPRLYDVSEGQVLVDDVDVRDYDLEVLRSKIGFVPQKAVLFSGTIDSNIGFGSEEADEYRIEEAVKIAQSYDFVMKKEEGFNSPVSQGGSNFSGGQRQRLAIARAIVRKPEIYVFDDSFSALDFKTDKALRAALAEETGDATVVIVAQRISTIMEADRIIVIEKGEVAGIGTHKELLKNCDIYREIAYSQLSEEDLKDE